LIGLLGNSWCHALGAALPQCSQLTELKLEATSQGQEHFPSMFARILVTALPQCPKLASLSLECTNSRFVNFNSIVIIDWGVVFILSFLFVDQVASSGMEDVNL
jgi:hypothetical protein